MSSIKLAAETNSTELTIETLERLADEASQDVTTQATRLTRLISAYARIIAAREPDKFSPEALALGDIPDCGGSYPPEMEYRDYNGPALLSIVDGSWSKIPANGNFEHPWKAVTDERGLYVSPEGKLYGKDTSGSGKFRNFPAHPDDCNVSLTFEFSPLRGASIDQLKAVEGNLRTIAFPLVAAAIGN